MMVLLKLMVFLSVVGWLFFTALSEVKEPFDTEKKDFDFKLDFWRFYWDNFGIMLFGCVLGFLLSHELAVPIINRFIEWPELAEQAIDLTSIAIGTYSMGFFLEYAWKKAKEK